MNDLDDTNFLMNWQLRCHELAFRHELSLLCKLIISYLYSYFNPHNIQNCFLLKNICNYTYLNTFIISFLQHNHKQPQFHFWVGSQTNPACYFFALGKIIFIVIDHAEFATVNHLLILLHIRDPTCISHMFREVCTFTMH